MSGQEFQEANPDDVDKGPVMAIGDCPNCGENTLATVRVEDAEYISSCSMCDYEIRAPVKINEDGKPIVVNKEAEEIGLE